MASMQSLLGDEKAIIALAVAGAAIFVGACYLYSVSRASKKKVSLSPEEWRQFQLVERIQVSHNVIKFKFALDSPAAVLGLPIGQHVSIQALDEQGKEFQRPYTPTSLDSDVGFIELVIKVYPAGAMSQVLNKLQVGDYLPFKGPKGRFKYIPNSVREFGMIGGGSGITPMYQVARAILENPSDKTKISLISANVTVEDILLKEELDMMAKKHPDRFKLYYVLNQPPERWSGGVGFVSADMIRERLPPPAEDIKILRCGPPPMNKAMAAHLDALGYAKEMQFQF